MTINTNSIKRKLLFLLLLVCFCEFISAQQQSCFDQNKFSISYYASGSYLINWTNDPEVVSYKVDVLDEHGNIVYTTQVGSGQNSTVVYTNLIRFWITLTADCGLGASGVGTEGITTVIDVPVAGLPGICYDLWDLTLEGVGIIIYLDHITDEETTVTLEEFCNIFCSNLNEEECSIFASGDDDSEDSPFIFDGGKNLSLPTIDLKVSNPVSDNYSYINFSFSENTTAYLTIYDMTGKVVKVLLNGKQYPKGNHKLSTNLSMLSTGLYLMELRSGKQTITQRFLKAD